MGNSGTEKMSDDMSSRTRTESSFWIVAGVVLQVDSRLEIKCDFVYIRAKERHAHDVSFLCEQEHFASNMTGPIGIVAEAWLAYKKRDSTFFPLSLFLPPPLFFKGGRV